MSDMSDKCRINFSLQFVYYNAIIAPNQDEKNGLAKDLYRTSRAGKQVIMQVENPKAVIQKVYYELQEKDNPIRNCILVASSRSETIARINAATR